MKKRTAAFTIIELLVVVSIIALLIGILLPAMNKARDSAKATKSQANLRNLAVAHANYGRDYNDKQFTLIRDDISTYGTSAAAAMSNWEAAFGQPHPPIYLGWTVGFAEGYGYHLPALESAGLSAYQPITFVSSGGTGGEYFGSFRLANVQAFNTYVNDRFYEPTFYAPKDTMVLAHIGSAFDSPYEYRRKADQGGTIGWSSYCMSPAGMYSPQVLSWNEQDQKYFTDPWRLSASFRTPAYSQCRYSALKTHMLEHHWLQQARADCNTNFDGGTYDGCEPFYFNHSWQSAPFALFYDGHIESIGVRQAEMADGRATHQSGYGLWSRDTTMGADGYFIDFGYDHANTSFHILTVDGILGRDKL